MIIIIILIQDLTLALASLELTVIALPQPPSTRITSVSCHTQFVLYFKQTNKQKTVVQGNFKKGALQGEAKIPACNATC